LKGINGMHLPTVFRFEAMTADRARDALSWRYEPPYGFYNPDPAQVDDLIVTFGDLHVFNVWSLNEQPALVIGMDLLGTLQRFVVDYRRGEFHFKTWETGLRPTEVKPR